ncbi:MAG: hypothetical protein ACF8XB_24655 [Planctomycetota bacterium JB042]
MRRRTSIGVGVLVAIAASGPSAPADIVVSGRRTVRVEVDLSLGRFAPSGESNDASNEAWRFFVVALGPTSAPAFRAVGDGERLPYHRYGATVIAVRGDVAGDFAAAFEGRGDGSISRLLETWKERPGVAVAERQIGGRASVTESSPVQTRVERWEVRSIEGNSLHLGRAEERDLDEDGEPVTGLSLVGGSNGNLLLLAAFALVALAVVVRRRSVAGP